MFCVRDGVDTIKDTMQSIINQSIKPDKIIPINDGSTDGTGRTLAEFKQKYPDLIEIIHTSNKTRDYKRIPQLLTKALRKDYEYHLVLAGDMTLEREYAEKLIKKMDADKSIVIAGGDFPPYVANAPHGAGRMVRQDFFFEHYDEFPYRLGYESEILFRAKMNNKKVQIYRDIKCEHLVPTGTEHAFLEWGEGMKIMGYHPLFVLGRCMTSRKKIGLKGGLNMLINYLKFKPTPTGYFSYHPEDIRKYVRKQQLNKMLGRKQ